MPWTTTRAFFVRRTATSGTSRLDAHREFRGFFDCLRGVRPNGPQDLFRGRFVHSLDPSDDGHFGVHLVDRLLHARRDRIRLRDPAEDVDQDYGRIRLDQEFEGLLDLRRIVPAAEVQEDAVRPSLEGQGVERGHRQARAIGDDADVPVQLDEDDALVVRLLLQRRPVLVQIRVLRMAVFRAVVDHELRVARDHAAASRHDEGIDLDELRVLFPEKIVGAAGDGGDLLSDVTLDRKRARQRPKDVRLDPDHRGDVFHEEVLPRDLLHVHAAHRGGHEERLPRGPIDREAEVKFLRDREALLEVHLLHPIPVDVRAEDLARDLTRSRNAFMIAFVVGPGLPSPIVRPSTSTTGATSAADPVMKASSAAHMSYKVKNCSLASRWRDGASSRTVSRVTPGRFVEVKGVTIVWLRTMKTFSALASET